MFHESRRMLLGGFLGGLFGILATGLFHEPWMLLMGVFLGSVVGYSHMSLSSVPSAIARSRRKYLVVDRYCRRNPKSKMAFNLRGKIANWCGLVSIATMAFTAIGINDYVSSYATPGERPGFVMALFGIAVAGIAALVLYFTTYDSEVSQSLQSKGLLTLILTAVSISSVGIAACLLLGSVIGPILFFGGIGWIAVTTAIYFSYAIVCGTVLLAAKMVYEAVMSRSYWLCLAVTLAVTAYALGSENGKGEAIGKSRVGDRDRNSRQTCSPSRSGIIMSQTRRSGKN